MGWRSPRQLFPRTPLPPFRQFRFRQTAAHQPLESSSQETLTLIRGAYEVWLCVDEFTPSFFFGGVCVCARLCSRRVLFCSAVGKTELCFCSHESFRFTLSCRLFFFFQNPTYISWIQDSQVHSLINEQCVPQKYLPKKKEVLLKQTAVAVRWQDTGRMVWNKPCLHLIHQSLMKGLSFIIYIQKNKSGFDKV